MVRVWSGLYGRITGPSNPSLSFMSPRNLKIQSSRPSRLEVVSREGKGRCRDRYTTLELVHTPEDGRVTSTLCAVVRRRGNWWWSSRGRPMSDVKRSTSLKGPWTPRKRGWGYWKRVPVPVQTHSQSPVTGVYRVREWSGGQRRKKRNARTKRQSSDE